MGEIGLPIWRNFAERFERDKYFALAEELDIPVAIHMGTGGSGRANLLTRGSAARRQSTAAGRASGRHPKLRVQIMHAGYPMMIIC